MRQKILEIAHCKKCFENNFENALDLIKVQAPLFVTKESGLQDELSGSETPVGFDAYGTRFEVVQSLAKWKRMALKRYDIEDGKGIYTDMKAIRQGEKIDAIHSLFVEQWDWEKAILEKDRNIDYLTKTVDKIYDAIKKTNNDMKMTLGIGLNLKENITFITSQELEDLYPKYKPVQREYLFAKDKKAIFIIGIGHVLKSGQAHDYRSPDYDDWNLNGDLILFDDRYDRHVELSSMGIRVNSKSLLKQLEIRGWQDHLEKPYHQMILNDELPLSIGGGIGQSRLLMYLLRKKHIAEVQASSWPHSVFDPTDDSIL